LGQSQKGNSYLSGHDLSVRRVVWILHACSKKEGLPWHRIVNRKGAIAALKAKPEIKARVKRDGRWTSPR